MSKKLFRSGISTMLLMVMVLTSNAQEFRGSITGKVTDPSGAVLPNATVKAKNNETNVVASVTTNDDGIYNISFLLPGKYTLTVTIQGFNTAQKEGIEVGVNNKLTLDITMEVGIVESVTTVSSTPLIEASSANIGQVVNSRQISELPLGDGTAYTLAILAPGITYTGDPKFSRPMDNANLAAFQSNGATGSNQITLDGSPNLASQGRVGYSPPSDAIQEFKVETNSFDAQQGYTAGANVNVATKSGTNDLHGSLYYFNRNENRAANDFFANRSGQGRSLRDYDRYGGTVSGPVYLPKIYNGRDRTFFFFAYERLQDISPEPALLSVPTEKMHRGDFSELLSLPAPIQIFDPATARLVSGRVVRTAFPGNIINPNRFNPIAENLIKFYPLPNLPGLSQNYFSPQTRTYDYDGILARVDHSINQNHKIFGKFYWNDRIEDRNDWAGVINGFQVTRGFDFRSNNGGNLDYTATLSPNLIFDIRLSASQFGESRAPAQPFEPADLGFSEQALATFGDYHYLPRFDLRNFTTLGAQRSDFKEGFNRPFYVYSVQPTVTKLRGKHTMKAGYDLRVLRENFVDEGYKAGRYFFDGTFTTPASNSSTAERNLVGRDFASLLLGIPVANANSSRDATAAYSAQSVYHGFFFHDDWRITPRLTLNLGLRYDVELGITERYNRIVRGFDPNAVNPLEDAAKTAYAANPIPQLPVDQFRVLGGYLFADESNRAMWDADKNNFQPRIGFAYKLTSKTVVRGGFGVFSAPFQIQANVINQAGFTVPTLFVPTLDNGLTFTSNLTNPFPGGLTASPGAANGLLTNVGRALGVTLGGANTVFSGERQNAQFSRVTIGIQQELPGKIVVEANFVSSWGEDLSVTRPQNFVPGEFITRSRFNDEAAQAANTLLTQTVPNPFRGLLPGTSFNGATIARSQLLLPFPEFAAINLETYEGSSRYNSLQLQVQKRFDRGLTLSTAYTWSRFREQITLLNGFDTELEDRVSPLDRPHRIAIGVVYELPFGRGQWIGGDWNKVVNAFLGGWQLQGTYEWQSGEPLVFNNNLFYEGDFNELRSRIGEKNELGQKFGIDIPGWDVAGFYLGGNPADTRNRLNSATARYFPTTLPHLRNMPYSNANLGLSKNFAIREGMRIQLRAEALNAFNYSYFISPNLDPSNPAFGLVSIQRNLPRDLQLGIKFVF